MQVNPQPQDEDLRAALGGPAPSPTFTELNARRLGPVRRFFVQHPVAMDVVVMLWFGVPSILTWLAMPTTVVTDLGTGPVPDTEAVVRRAMMAGAALVAVGTAVLFWRRRRPVLVTALMTVLAVASTLLAGSVNGFELGIALGLYAVAASRPALTTWLTFAGAMILSTGVVWFWELPIDLTAAAPAGVTISADGTTANELGTMRLLTSAFLVIYGLMAIAIGTSVRNRRLHIADLVERTNALTRDRDQQARLARASERSRIAREMHDVVAHSLSVMIALADGAGAALNRAPDRTRQALDELSDTGRSALADMRRVLGVLNEPEAPFEPQPGSVDLVTLVDRFRMVGVPVRASGLSSPLPADAGVQLAVYRIVQESLTNTLRHAPGTPNVSVTVRTLPGRIEVEVTDDGPGVPAPSTDGAGHGLIGMRERAGVYGGTVDAGPWHGGWRVHAVLPWHGIEEDVA